MHKLQCPFLTFALLIVQRPCENGTVMTGGDLILPLHPKHLVTLGGQKYNSATVNKVAGGSGWGGLCGL